MPSGPFRRRNEPATRSRRRGTVRTETSGVVFTARPKVRRAQSNVCRPTAVAEPSTNGRMERPGGCRTHQSQIRRSSSFAVCEEGKAPR